MTPTIIETIFYCILGTGCLVFMFFAPHFNPFYNPKGDDPYRYCPKEEEK